MFEIPKLKITLTKMHAINLLQCIVMQPLSHKLDLIWEPTQVISVLLCNLYHTN